MNRLQLAILVAAAAALPTAATALAARTAPPQLDGVVGPGYVISLKHAGKPVTSLHAGTYSLRVSDRSPIHDFVIEREHGGAFEKTVTSVPFVGTKTITIRLGRGEWKFYCAPHESAMNGKLEVR